MWYAIEYAYGSHVVNNGNRADRVLEFSNRKLRDAFVSAGPSDTTATGYREAAGARHPLVRKATWKDDGDAEGWRVLAEQRVEQSPTLAKHQSTIYYDWPEADHWRWVATAPEREIANWAKATNEAMYAE